MFRLRFVSLIVGFALVGQLMAADPAETSLYSTDNLQGTKSVMVRRSSLATADPSAAATPTRIVDKNVQQASATEPLGSLAAADSARVASDAVDTASAAASQAATDLLGHALEAPKNSPLPGHTLTLLQAISPFGSNRAAQLAIARAYWKLSAAEGDYNWAVDEADQLEHVAAGTGAMDATVLATARASTQARLLEAKLAAVTTQQELADLLGIPANNPLPLASDAPLVGAYRTYFETLYSGRLAPPRMRLIDRTLPIRREAIETHVAAVQAAASAVHAADEARTKSQADLHSLLLCEADLSRQRRSFLAAVRDYNLDIDEYALTVAEPNVPTDRVIGMLIRIRPAAPPAASVAPPASSVGPPAASGSAPAAGDPTAGHPLPNDALMQPALPAGTRPSPAANPTGLGNPTQPSPNASPTGPASPTVPSNPAVPSSAPAPSKAAGAVDPRAPVNPATIENPFAPTTLAPTSPAPTSPAAPATPPGPASPPPAVPVPSGAGPSP